MTKRNFRGQSFIEADDVRTIFDCFKADLFLYIGIQRTYFVSKPNKFQNFIGIYRLSV